MAIVILGKTTCSICGRPLLTDQEIEAFPAFLKKTHPLARYSDAAFHKECFDKSSDATAVTKLYDRYCKIWENRPQGLVTEKEVVEWGKSAFAEFE